MFPFLLFAVVWASCLAMPPTEHYSYSPAVGAGSGTPFSSSGEGRITGVRIWENSNSYINGIQLRYTYIWAPVLGRTAGNKQELNLFDGEAFVQVSGKYHPSNYIYQLIFVTNRGRSVIAGQPVQISFNHYPTYEDAELRLLSGRFNGNGITSLGAHWGMVYKGNTTTE
ncbi:zymogen granule membrane protein 16-like [Polymixia lowei]